MPLYEYDCPGHGVYEIRVDGDTPTGCPECGIQGERIMSVTAPPVIKNKERLPYGNGARGQYIKGENGRRDIFVPSFGAMEQDEVDYTVQGAIEQEEAKAKVRKPSEQKEAIAAVVKEMRKAKPGERAKVVEEMKR